MAEFNMKTNEQMGKIQFRQNNHFFVLDCQEWTADHHLDHFLGIGRHRKGTFQGVRVKNPVRELLLQKRSKFGNVANETRISKAGMNSESCTELKNILRNHKRTHDFTSEAPAAKQLCPFPSSFLTPPSTPNPNECMDEISKTDMSADSTLDVLQSIINIKNESKPVSLNTVQVSWTNNIQQSDVAQEQCFQGSASQAYSMCSLPQNNEPYAIGSLQMPQVPSNTHQDYNPFPANSPVQSSFFSNEFQSCSVDSYMPAVVGQETSPEIEPGVKAIESCMPAPNFIPTANASTNAFWENHIVQSSHNVQSSHSVQPQLCLSDQNNPNPFQVGKSFFQWQIEQEERKLANVSDEQLISKDSDGDTCLHISVAQGRRPFSYVVARRMTAINMLDIKEHNNQSALQVAVAANQHLIVQDLISLGADVRTTDYWGRTPLHVCAINGYTKVIEAIHKGLATSNQYVDVDAINYDGLTALHCAVIAHNAVLQQLMNNAHIRSPATEELMQKNKAMVDTVKTLLMMGASVEAQDRKSGRTALHLAAEEANLELLTIFLELPNSLSFINAKAFNGNTALHVAASLQFRKTHLGAVRLLMRKGADPSARNLENEQPVHLVPDGPVGEEIRRVLKGKAVQQRSSPY
ncbi:NF-kappa-B inhibitor zeta [Pelobates cultripes]|uniref:NF-kappa-B inhibitor zeta, partial n=1 Tax=Pelobates cultripes TaxID=61616 RepID=A0AAD1R682_PELCU|nr:NF-kappa-B inhibitor zeta [Pelobates cultripes]